jgi:L-seryl-tRNA(Ser) seleniumtransferase
VRDTEAWEIRDAITENTAAVAYVANAQARPLLSEVVVSAHTHNVPVIVDATCQLPPQSNLERFIAEGADVVCFSGGKAIRGPQSSDILCGLRDLISAAALQHLDQDVFIDLWNPPDSLIDKSKLPGAPHHGLGRPCKVGKEEIVGIITALSLFVSEGDEARSDRWRGIAFHLVELLKSIPYLSVSVTLNHARTVPTVNVELDE